MDSNKIRVHKTSSAGPITRKHSITAQLSRSARRLSAVVAPSFTKLDPFPLLQKYNSLTIRMTNITQLEVALERYVANNSVQFSPIDFEVLDENDSRILNVSLHPEEMVLTEGARRIFSVTFSDSSCDESGSVISKIRHPISGMRVFEFLEQSDGDQISIMSAVDDSDRCCIEQFSSSWLGALTLCGFLFTRTQWHFKKDSKLLAVVKPQCAFFDENAIRCSSTMQLPKESLVNLFHRLRKLSGAQRVKRNSTSTVFALHNAVWPPRRASRATSEVVNSMHCAQ